MRHRTWVRYVVVSTVVQGIVRLLALVLIGYLLVLLLPFLHFFVGTALFYVFAGVYADAMDLPVAETAA